MSELKRVHVVILTAGSLAGSILGAYEDINDASDVRASWLNHAVDGRTDKPTIVTSWVFPAGNRSDNNREGTRAANERAGGRAHHHGFGPDCYGTACGPDAPGSNAAYSSGR